MESNLGPTENDFESAVSCPKKLKCLKEQQKRVILAKTIPMLLMIEKDTKLFSHYSSTNLPRQY